MKPFRDNDLRQVINKQWESVKSKIDRMPNDVIMANDLEVLADNVYQEFFIEPVTLFEEDFSKRNIKQGKISKYVEPFFRDYGQGEYIQVDGIIATFHFPFQGAPTLFSCRASSFSLGGYPEITVKNKEVVFQIERTLSEMNSPEAHKKLLGSLDENVSEIRHGLSLANQDVEAFNSSLKKQAIVLLREKRKKVEVFFNAAKMLEVPIEKKQYAQTHIPLKRTIVPITKHYEQSNYYGIGDAEYKDILSSIKHTASTYERTPRSYKSLHEEDLRNTLLAALNATYMGDATGETFRNTGKTDICIEKENRAAFVAECKMWTGQKEISNAIDQLDGYLTWRDCKTALIYFVRRKDFLKTLSLAEHALREYDNMKNVSAVDRNEFDCLFLSKTNPGQQVKMRVMLFNMFCGE